MVVTCINKIRDEHGKIINYKLQDTQGNTRFVLPEQLKVAIFNGDIAVDNLKLTSDGRLIDCKREELNTLDSVVGRRNLDYARKLVADTSKLLGDLMPSVGKRDIVEGNGLGKTIKVDGVKFKLPSIQFISIGSELPFVLKNGDKIVLPTIVLHVDKAGNLGKDVKIHNQKVLDSMHILDESNSDGKVAHFVIGVDSHIKKKVRDEIVLCDYDVYCGWIGRESNNREVAVQNDTTNQLSLLFNATLDLMEFAIYDSILKGEQNEETLEASYAKSSSMMLAYDLDKTLGLMRDTKGFAKLSHTLTFGLVEKLFTRALEKISVDGIEEADIQNDVAREHFNKARQSFNNSTEAATALNASSFTSMIGDKASEIKGSKTSDIIVPNKQEKKTIFNMFKR